MDAYDRMMAERYRMLAQQTHEVAMATSEKEKQAIRDSYGSVMNPTTWQFVRDNTLALTFCALSALMCAAGYVGIFGYGIGSFLNYVFVEQFMMPFEFHTMYMCGMIPFLNVLLSVIAFWMLLLKYIFIGIVWLYTVVMNWLPLWIANM